MRRWTAESFEDFWAAAKTKAAPELLATLEPKVELYFRLDSVHVALEIYKGLSAAFVNLSVGDGRGWWVRDLAEWLKASGFERLYWCAEAQTWGRVLLKRYEKLGVTSEPILKRPGWALYQMKLDKV